MTSEDSAIWRIESRADSFYTNVGNQIAEVVVATHDERKYLKTDADGYAPNNLLSLDDCANCKIIS